MIDNARIDVVAVINSMAPSQLFQISSIAPPLACVCMLLLAGISVRGAA
jgi:hypothetical protein